MSRGWRQDQVAASLSQNVDLSLNPSLGLAYTSRAQVARVVTENWVAEQVYCPACDCDDLAPTPPGTEVVDFLCQGCAETRSVAISWTQETLRLFFRAFSPTRSTTSTSFSEGNVPTRAIIRGPATFSSKYLR